MDVGEERLGPIRAFVTKGRQMTTPATATAGGHLHLPSWVPDAARHYLEHVETGLPIRALARRADVHASTILRQVRRLENRRDDPLVDSALRQLSGCFPRYSDTYPEELPMIPHHTDGRRGPTPPADAMPDLPGTDQFEADATRVLRRLSETGAVLAVAQGMKTAVVVRDKADGEPQRLASLDRSVAEAMALKDWIACDNPDAKISRYRITAAGRAALRRMLGVTEQPEGFAETQMSFDYAPAAEAVPDDAPQRNLRSSLSESPLTALARRRDRNGRPFLERDLVAAGERLREDYELAQIGPSVTQDWDRFLTGPEKGRSSGSFSAGDARDRVAAALAELGPGLGDVALRCCCYREGLERLEQRMGWSARSGKIVLRIALQRLRRHYDSSTSGKMIG